MAPIHYLPSLKHVAICGGTHGNEMSGIFLVKHWLRNPTELQRDTFHATPFLGNPRAVDKCVRYIDRDLNRTFSAEFLNSKDSDIESYEVQRTWEVNQIFGPKGSFQAYDFMFDLHNTTSNMGACLIVDSEHSLLPMHMCNYIQKHYTKSSCPIFLYQLPGEETYGISSVAKAALGMLFPAFKIEAHKVAQRIDYPRYSDGEISAVVHPNLQDKDFLPLKPGDPIFQTVNGEPILYEGNDITYPAFINEAAYYEKKVAFVLMEKHTFSLPALQKKF
ncbi:N-acyl-aromatic-L-amino acid amidohydrolase (carboxylate-forming) isoform X2 [Eublepharis macularius]|uniref:N-acyl-aromatic-L-amino acid amidohydrolase n=1 Tax=Eublepharis macularius TaxID=481883 RepID=A0AA97KR69_EUBMA|nr:N-acyl-aromatic-L-amino acid amidohydrolase (carboxylate-forming) isoform X2 [Eublepharis macularius]